MVALAEMQDCWSSRILRRAGCRRRGAFRMFVERIGALGEEARRGCKRRGPRSTRALRMWRGRRRCWNGRARCWRRFRAASGVAMAAVPGGDQLEHVHFSRLAVARVLAVVVTRGGMVRDRVLTLEGDLTAVELETAGNFLNENFRGWEIERVRAGAGGAGGARTKRVPADDDGGAGALGGRGAGRRAAERVCGWGGEPGGGASDGRGRGPRAAAGDAGERSRPSRGWWRC